MEYLMAAPITNTTTMQPSKLTLVQEEAIVKIQSIVGIQGYIVEPNKMLPYLTDWRGVFTGQAELIARPSTTEEVSKIVRSCAKARISIVPQGGNTSMCGGSVPLATGPSIILSLARMDKIRDMDEKNYTMTVEAGCILQKLQEIANKSNRCFPLSLAAEGSCMIGGNLATNAGGTNVLRYGNARDLVLGLEVVLPDGQILESLQALRKDNTGYDLKQLFLGSEGTLGIITAAVLKLFPKPRRIYAAYCAVKDVAAAIELLNRARPESGDCIETFELISRLVMDLVLKHIPNTQDPLPERYDHYVLIELASTADDDEELHRRFEAILATAMEDGLILDAALAQSEAQRLAFWALRENATESQKIEGASIKHDISVPISSIAPFYEAAWNAVLEVEPKARLIAFGHAGDGNLHFNIAEPEEGQTQDFIDKWDSINTAVHKTVHQYNGSISAEHGIGQLKRDELTNYKSAIALDLMRKIKKVLDPYGIMNPGKVI
jgi:FAD/FMN-containing dehydrogenase